MEPDMSRRVKRQVRPNMSRTDFGYVERSRSALGKAHKVVKSKREEEEDGNLPSMRSEKDSRGLLKRLMRQANGVGVSSNAVASTFDHMTLPLRRIPYLSSCTLQGRITYSTTGVIIYMGVEPTAQRQLHSFGIYLRNIPALVYDFGVYIMASDQ
eukprot:scaffold14000_cov135-Isochrysis_galbana.AAC.3